MSGHELWTVFRIWQNDGIITVDFETNDNNDDGYPDPEVTRATYHPKTLEAALSLAGKSRCGVYGHRVYVYLNGILI